mmetsp:Transcript_35541/g.74928  ORF Transcript_35541/g.74928 Transcript_35541/m.74928 type:complete len:245 (-) Transcript_35541:426-1160(-)
MDGETPSWLEEGSSSTPAADPSPPASSPTAASEPSAPPSSFSTPAPSAKTTARVPTDTTDNVAGSILASTGAASPPPKPVIPEADEKDLPKMILFMRILNMAAAALLITCSVLALIPSGTHLSVWVTAIYAMCGGILVCCLETQLKFIRTIIAMNFGFLFNSVYRFVFYLLMASVTWSYEGILGYITAITLGCVAVFNTYVLCRYPAYRKMREKIAGEEDKRIQAKINQQVRKQAVSSMGWGSS